LKYSKRKEGKGTKSGGIKKRSWKKAEYLTYRSEKGGELVSSSSKRDISCTQREPCGVGLSKSRGKKARQVKKPHA